MKNKNHSQASQSRGHESEKSDTQVVSLLKMNVSSSDSDTHSPKANLIQDQAPSSSEEGF